MEPSWRKDYIRYKSYFLNLIGRYKERSDVKAYLEIILSLITISIFSVFALRPTLLTIGELIKEIESRKQILSQMNDKIKNLSQAQSLYDKQRSKIALLKIAVPKKADPINLARQIEGLSFKNKAVVLGMSSEKAYLGGVNDKSDQVLNNTDNSLNELIFSVQTTAPLEEYSALSSFLSDLENLRRIVKVDKLIINVNEIIENENVQKSLIFNIEGRVFYH
ncbi:hypothetical protein A2159_00040 [Candidatus Woesebacteria bacterium RBG_13_34_9]|uniref:Uncharacterized protein n=1 Tax=Candidatus Woesebacteria bacterium RBG_13_34_9 TaxID=1802477 RepID=A0A1F7X494_9BACT|nr:MAG: hypothetical protein A2159_00040 [Candidatus Woesebacteria bacterium RBG_13_34_9]